MRSMPRVKVMLPDPLLQVAADQAHAAGKGSTTSTRKRSSSSSRHPDTRPGALRNHGRDRTLVALLTIEISEKVFQDAEKLAKRLGQRRDAIYALALYKHVRFEAHASSAFDQGHDLPEGAWKAKKSS